MVPKHFAQGAYSSHHLEFLSQTIAERVIDASKDDTLAHYRNFALNDIKPHSAKFRCNIFEILIHYQFLYKKIKAPLNGKTLGSSDVFEITFDTKKLDVGASAFMQLDLS